MAGLAVSIVILTYNHEKYVAQAIDSVLAQQTSFNYEIIVADDSSKDMTKSVICEYREKYPHLIKLNLHDENLGTTRNLCNAFLTCRGKYIATLAGDDYWIDTGKLQKQFDWLETNENYIGVSHIIEARNDDGESLGKYPDSILIGKDASVELFLKGIYFSTSSTMFKNIYLSSKADDYIRLITSSRLIEDVSLAMILLDEGKVFVLGQCLAVYRARNEKNQTNYNSIRNSIDKYRDHVEVYSANDKFFKGKYDFSKLYAIASANSFSACLKQKMLVEFFKTFINIPFKAKLISFIYIIGNIVKKIMPKK